MPLPTLKVRWREGTNVDSYGPQWDIHKWNVAVNVWDRSAPTDRQRFRYGEMVGVMGGQAVVVESKTGAVHLFGSGYLQRIPIKEDS